MNSQSINQADVEMKLHVGPPSAGDNDSVDSESVGSGDDPANEDAEGVWSPDIEQSFQEALLIYPPCGRRKIILSDEGKMYGRNELIARYIRLRTGKSRTRKQVSSHIQVLARRKSKEIQSALKDAQQKERAIQTLNQLSSAQIVSATLMVAGGQQNAASAQSVANKMSAPAASTQAANSNGSNVLEVLQALNNVQNANSIGSLAQTSASSPLNRSLARPTGAMCAPQLHSGGQYGAAMLNAAVSSLYGSAPSQATASGAFSDGGLLMPSSLPLSVGSTAWAKRAIAGPQLKLVEFTAFAERRGVEPEHDVDENAVAAQRGNASSRNAVYGRHVYVHIGNDAQCADEQQEAIDIRQIADKFPDRRGGLRELFESGPLGAFYLVKFWADLNVSVDESQAAQLVTTVYESMQPFTIKCSTKVCSFGRQVVEKIETESGQAENGRYVYRLTNVAMCDYMINFLARMRQLPEPTMMNKVLENFTILNVVTNADSKQTLLCLAFVFEVSTSEHGAQCNVYRLVRDA